MKFIITLAIFVVSAYIIQAILGLKQTEHFNKYFIQMRRNGKVLIGKKKGFFSPGVIVMLQINENNVVTEAVKMQGLTVFSKFKSLNSVIGLSVNELDQKNDRLQMESRFVFKALANAKDNYLKFEKEINSMNS